MSRCVFDDPKTMCRYEYRDGVVLQAITAEYLRSQAPVVRPFEPGKIVGDARALVPDAEHDEKEEK